MSVVETTVVEDLDTGEVLDILVDDDDDDEDDGVRNAVMRSYSNPGYRHRTPGRRVIGRRRPYYPSYRPPYVRPRPRPMPAYTGGRPAVIVNNRDHISIDKGKLVQMLPAAGKVIASFIGIPSAPRATGNDVTDRDNAAEHREVLAKHGQTERRIQALAEFAAKAVTVFGN